MRFSPSHPAVALGLLAFAMALMPLNDVIIKTIGPGHSGYSRLVIDGPLLSLTLLIFLRSLLIFAVLAYFPATIASLRGISARLWGLLLVRGFTLGMSMMLFFIGLALMPLWQAVSVFFIAPLLISLLSVPFLGERLGVWRVMAQVMGFGGVLIMVLPGAGSSGSEGLDWSFVLPLLSAFYYAMYNIMTRLIGDQVTTLSMTNIQHLGYMLVGLICALIIWLLPFDTAMLQAQSPGLAFILRPWAMPTWEQAGYMMICGAMIALLSYASANAYSHLEASLVSPFEYAYMPLSLIWSIVVWNEYPNTFGYIGGGLIWGRAF